MILLFPLPFSYLGISHAVSCHIIQGQKSQMIRGLSSGKTGFSVE